jgi:hypothetical protein
VETRAGELGAEVLSPYGEELGEVVDAAHIQALADAYLIDGALMEMVLLESGSGAAAEEPAAPYRRLFHGLTALCALLLALVCAMRLAGDTQKAAAVRVRSAGRLGAGFVLTGGVLAGIAAGAFIGVTVSAGGLIYPGLVVDAKTEILMGTSYALALGGLTSVLTVLLKTDMFPALISFVFIFAALLGGVFFDLREVMASWAFLRFFFLNYYYLDGIGQGPYVLPWSQAAILSGVGFIACIMVFFQQKRG